MNINKLSIWKIFFRKKKEEIYGTVKNLDWDNGGVVMSALIIFAFVPMLVLGTIGYMFGLVVDPECNGYGCHIFSVGITLYIVLGGIALLGTLLYIFLRWLHDNWKESVEEYKEKK